MLSAQEMCFIAMLNHQLFSFPDVIDKWAMPFNFSSNLCTCWYARKDMYCMLFSHFYVLVIMQMRCLLLFILYLYLIALSSYSFARMDRQRREEELKTRSSKKGHDAEQSILNRVCHQ